MTEIHRHHSVLTVTDQYGRVYTYPVDAVPPTAVPLTVLSPPWEQPDDHHRHRDPTDGAVTSGAARGGAGHWSLISFFAQGWLLAPPHPLRS